MKNIEIDIETYSSVSLQKCGVYKYAESPDFEILLFGYSIDGGPVATVDLACGEKIPADVLDVLTDDTVTKWAFNAQFERVCLSRYLSDLGLSLDPFRDKHALSTECADFLIRKPGSARWCGLPIWGFPYHLKVPVRFWVLRSKSSQRVRI